MEANDRNLHESITVAFLKPDALDPHRNAQNQFSALYFQWAAGKLSDELDALANSDFGGLESQWTPTYKERPPEELRSDSSDLEKTVVSNFKKMTR
jgi:hypothetical protein